MEWIRCVIVRTRMDLALPYKLHCHQIGKYRCEAINGTVSISVLLLFFRSRMFRPCFVGYLQSFHACLTIFLELRLLLLVPWRSTGVFATT